MAREKNGMELMEDGKMGRWEEEKLEPGRWKEWNECGNV
jgi:hypothetical protein